jgi:membrane protease YdiL (CAAX protease family)
MKNRTEIMNRLLAYSPNLKQSWILVIVATIGGGIIEVMASKTIEYIGITTNEYAYLFGWLMQVAFVVLVVNYLGKNSNYVPVSSPRQPLLLWLLLVPFIFSVDLATHPLMMWIPMPDIIEQKYAELYQSNLSTFLLLVIILPVYQEWLYRGIILKGLLRHYSPFKAILWSAVIFGVIHLNPWQGVIAFCLALAIGWVYWQTKSLWLCIFMHTANSAMSFLIEFVIPKGATSTIFAGGYYIYVVALFVCVITGIWIKNIITVKAQNC